MSLFLFVTGQVREPASRCDPQRRYPKHQQHECMLPCNFSTHSVDCFESGVDIQRVQMDLRPGSVPRALGLSAYNSPTQRSTCAKGCGKSGGICGRQRARINSDTDRTETCRTRYGRPPQKIRLVSSSSTQSECGRPSFTAGAFRLMPSMAIGNKPWWLCRPVGVGTGPLRSTKNSPPAVPQKDGRQLGGSGKEHFTLSAPNDGSSDHSRLCGICTSPCLISRLQDDDTAGHE